MTWQVLVTVFTLGGLGAMVRGSITMILASSARIFPMAILIVNLLAAYLGGFLLQLELPEGLNAAIAIGLIGGIGTLSAIHGNLLDLLFDKAYRRLALYLGLTIFGGVLCCYAGMGTGNFVMSLLQGPQNLQNQMMMDTLKQQEQYLNSLQHEGHIDYENLPQLSPLPEGQESLEESIKALDRFKEEAAKAAGADAAVPETVPTGDETSDTAKEVESADSTSDQSAAGDTSTDDAAIPADAANSIDNRETAPIEDAAPAKQAVPAENGDTIEPSNVPSSAPESESSPVDLDAVDELESQTAAQHLQQLNAFEIASITQFNKVGA